MQRIEGFQVFIDRNGKQVAKPDNFGASDCKVRERHNGPHHDAKWARRLLNTPSQAEYRCSRVNALMWKEFAT